MIATRRIDRTPKLRTAKSGILRIGPCPLKADNYGTRLDDAVNVSREEDGNDLFLTVCIISGRIISVYHGLTALLRVHSAIYVDLRRNHCSCRLGPALGPPSRDARHALIND